MALIPTFAPDYPGAIVVPANMDNVYSPAGHGGVPNRPRAFIMHTPEEAADANEVTPRWFQQYHPDRRGSTHYYVSDDGTVYQCVPESWGAIANGFNPGNPQRLVYPAWAAAFSLNWQTLSVEIENYAHLIHTSMYEGSPQFEAVVRLVTHRAKAYGFATDRDHIMGHYQLSVDRSDPGARFPWPQFIAALNEEDEMAERIWCAERQQTWILGKGGAAPVLSPEQDKVYQAIYGPHTKVMTGAQLDALRVK